MRTTLLLTLALSGLVACGGDDNKTADAAIDMPSRPVLPLTAQAYCDTIQAACTAVPQYPSAAQCLATAAQFPTGAASTETSGNTLGCRIYHAQNAMISGDTATHCPHAGPIGGKVDAATSTCAGAGQGPCDVFCALEAKVCGTDAAPVTGVTNRYTTTAACMTACTAFSKTVQFSPSATSGDTFACRVYHLTNAANFTAMAMPTSVNAHCGHTLSPATSQCVP